MCRKGSIPIAAVRLLDGQAAGVVDSRPWRGGSESGDSTTRKRELLVAATVELPSLRAVIARAERRWDLRGLWVVQASVRELDAICDLVEELMDGTRSRRQLEQLESMLATLCTSMDGF